ncbi:carboxylating nicotinate-nucleotide diphosphorylase [Angustibacter speluncae]
MSPQAVLRRPGDGPGWPVGTVEELEAADLSPEWVGAMVSYVVSEDLGGNPGRDVTTQATIPVEQRRTVHVVARADGVLAGLPLVPVVLADVARRLQVDVPVLEPLVRDGTAVVRGDVLARITGSTQVLLMAERTLLNLVCRASGVATHTRRWVEALEGTGAMVLDTRKTTPGLRALEKYAVRAGGGTNKRMGLYDVAMVKDNHKLAAGSLTAAVDAVRSTFPDVPVQVEVTTVEEAVEAVGAGARFLLCDNFDAPTLADAVKAARAATDERLEIEATGGLTLEVAAEYARTGVDYLSVGGLTHSSPVLDLALDVVD